MRLGIDTSAGQCAVALVDAEGVRARQIERMTRGHAERLFPLIEAALAEAGAHYHDITGIGVCTGPGSFTGIRAGVAAARGLGLGLGVAVHGLDRFEALRLGTTQDQPLTVALAGPQQTVFLATPEHAPHQTSLDALPAAQGLRLGDGWPGAGEEAGLPDPAILATAAKAAPKPFYLRPPNADPPREAPPRMLD
ncbi:MAG: tRNA (adenosine(37)-N6)-threonylcarbamoyltransferase complex dimerization subunit type 1 TsaB [Pseudomonadota bacterium]